MTSTAISFRDATAADLAATFALAKRAMHAAALERRFAAAGGELTDAQIAEDWRRSRGLVEHLAAQPGGSYLVAEGDDGVVGYARVVRFGFVEELTELMVSPVHQGNGIGGRLLGLVWPENPTLELGRLIVATGHARDLSLYVGAGVMPVAGHWQLRASTDAYLERRSHEIDASDAAVHVLKRDRAVAEWNRLEPAAIGIERPALHEFFSRDRTCLAGLDAASGEALSLCWVSADGEIGPAVGRGAGDIVPVVVAALDRVAMTLQPPELHVFSTTFAWWLLRRLRGLSFAVDRPGWILSTTPMPGLDRYLPARPPKIL